MIRRKSDHRSYDEMDKRVNLADKKNEVLGSGVGLYSLFKLQILKRKGLKL